MHYYVTGIGGGGSIPALGPTVFLSSGAPTIDSFLEG